jgi:hypothetical protein
VLSCWWWQLASFELTFLAPMREFVKREMKEVRTESHVE